MQHCAVRLGVLSAVVGLAGCASQYFVRPTAYDINLHIRPDEHMLVARATMELEALNAPPTTSGEVLIGFELNKALTVSAVNVEGSALRRISIRPAPRQTPDDTGPANYQQHILYLDHAASFLTVTMDYYGALQQDVASGEKPGEIHNFSVSAHIAPEGTYLAPEGHWYPSPLRPNENRANPKLFLADWRIEADHIDGYELIAGARRQPGDDEQYVWTSPRKVSEMTLVGGPLEVWSQPFEDVDIRVYLGRSDDPDVQKENEKIARRYLEETARYIDRYEQLLGPFPYDQYNIVENFFSSGFAFPMMTLLGPTVMRMGDNSFRHGYLDHELVHSWWGCAVRVDPRDGNWCEALTTYCANYYGFVLDRDAAGARRKRRNESNFLSRISPEKDKPLGTFGLKDGAGRGIAYEKGAAVFDMLARKIGQEHFWQGCRMLARKYIGRYASWEDLKQVFESAGDQDLTPFFNQWVRGRSAPTLHLTSAGYGASDGKLTVHIEQGETPFKVQLPLRIHYDRGYDDIIAPIQQTSETIAVEVDRKPLSVELDPDYHVFRRLEEAQIMPTTATTKSAKRLTIVVPDGTLPEPYATVADSFTKAVQSDSKSKKEVVTIVADDSLTAERLSTGGVLVLGEAVRHRVVQALLERTLCPVRWHEGGFTVDDQAFDAPNYAVLGTVHHPDSPADGITFYSGNSERALANAAILGFYANSLLVFESDGRSKVLLRRDFESHERIELALP